MSPGPCSTALLRIHDALLVESCSIYPEGCKESFDLHVHNSFSLSESSSLEYKVVEYIVHRQEKKGSSIVDEADILCMAHHMARYGKRYILDFVLDIIKRSKHVPSEDTVVDLIGLYMGSTYKTCSGGSLNDEEHILFWLFMRKDVRLFSECMKRHGSFGDLDLDAVVRIITTSGTRGCLDDIGNDIIECCVDNGTILRVSHVMDGIRDNNVWLMRFCEERLATTALYTHSAMLSALYNGSIDALEYVMGKYDRRKGFPNALTLRNCATYHPRCFKMLMELW